MNVAFTEHLRSQLRHLEADGLLKRERVLTSPQGAWIEADGRRVVNLCANNYLGLAGHPDLVAAARDALPRYGYGLSSVRFICGTQDVHKELEARLARFLGFEDAILFSSCFDANGGVFEALLGEEDAVVSDALNHASIIDGIRLCKARRYRYANGDMADLDAQLREAEAGGARFKLVVTDGVFSMDGSFANLPAICDLGGPPRRARHGGRQPRGGLRGRAGARHPRAGRRRGPGGPRHGHARQGARRGLGRLRGRLEGDRGVAPPARAPLPLLEHARPGHRGGEPRHPRPDGGGGRAPPQAPGERARTSAPGWRSSASSCCRASTPSSRSCSTRRGSRRRWRRGSWRRAST